MKQEIIRTYRKALERRYQIENLRRFPDLHLLIKEDVDMLRLFFIEYIYPIPAQRERRDEALDALLGILKSKRKLWPLFTTTLRSVVGVMGKDFLSITNAAFHTVESYKKSVDFENLLFKEAQKEKLFADNINEAILKNLVYNLPTKKVIQFQKEIFTLFSTLSNSHLLQKMISIMKICEEAIQKKQNLYTKKEIEGISHGLMMLSSAYELFCQLSPEKVNTILKGIRLVEEDWYQKCQPSVART